MIDTHCHLLPGLDDGPSSPGEALALAHGLVDAGVHTVTCTPHFSRRFPTDHVRAGEVLELLAAELAREKLPLRIALAAEVSSAAAVEAPLAEIGQRQLGGGYVLVELESDTAAGVVEVASERLADHGLTPVFAHPERCRAVRSQPHILDAARRAGALVQIVAPSLTGRWGEGASNAAWHLLESGRVDLLASDAHRARDAGERLARVLELVSSRLGSPALVQLTETNAARFVARAAESA